MKTDQHSQLSIINSQLPSIHSQLSTVNSQLKDGYKVNCCEATREGTLGYKQAEVGIVPEGWNINPFGALYAEPSRNGIYKSAEHQGRGTRIVNMGEMFGLEFISNQEMNRISLTPKEIVITGLFDGDLLFGRRSVVPAGAGKCSLVVTPPEPLTFESSIIRVRLDQSKACPLFYYYFYASPVGRSLMSVIISGTNIKGIRGTELSGLKVPCPDPTEQRAIATALSDVDALIESLEQLVAKKRHIKQGTMQQLLTGKKRLPGFSGEWEVKRLRDCLLANPDYGINAPGVPSSGDLPVYLRITDIDDDGYFIANNCVAVNHPQSPNYILNENEIVFARTGASVGKTYLYDPADGTIVFAGFLIRARIDCLKMSPTFFAAFTRTGRYWNWIRVMSMRSGQPGINSNEYASLELHLPHLAEQTAIAAILSDMDSEIAGLEFRLAKTRELKQGMMQVLLTGKIRLTAN